MSFVSYAQNFEDVMLWRALKHIENGFYVDVGAWSPDVDSVTRVFYENGWRGLNIEPNPEFIKRSRKNRPEDISLEVAIGERPGEAEFYFVSNSGLSSLDKNVAERHKSSGWPVRSGRVKVITLKEVFEQYVAPKDIHFLKVDVEGLEKSVLLSNDWKAYRPWIVVVEATLPLSQVENHVEWESVILDEDYVFTYADGLNRFYVAVEHSELIEAFKLPPNVFDHFVMHGQIHAEARVEQAEARIIQAETKAEQAEIRAQQAEVAAKIADSRAQKVEIELQGVYSSRSWRITAPLRWFIQQLRILRDYGLKARLRVAGEKVAYKCKAVVRSYLESNAIVKHKIIVVADRLGFYPVLRSIYRRFIKDRASKGVSLGCFGGLLQPSSLDELPPRAKQLYFELKSSSSQQQENH